MRVLGIDPGSNFVGLGCVEAQGRSFAWIGHQVLRVNLGGKVEFPARLKTIHEGVLEAITLWRPEAVVIEEVFMAKNAQSALKLGQARGAAMVAAAVLDLPIFEYSATVIKQAVTGSGRAEKGQVQRMIQSILFQGKPVEFEREDASDALAVAICHLQHRHRIALLNPKKGLDGPRASR